MLVKNWMSKDVVTVDAQDSVQDAALLLRRHNIRGLPVLDQAKLVGIITDRDIKKASASDATSLEAHELLYLIAKLKVEDVMTKDPVTVPVDYTVEEAAQILLEKDLSRVPVVAHTGQVKGMITQADIFRVLISLTGVRQKGIQFAFLLEDRPGSIKEVTDVIRNYGCRIVSIMSTFEGKEEEGYRHVYIRARDCDRDKVPQLKEELKTTARLLYAADYREKTRELYESYHRPWSSWVVG